MFTSNLSTTIRYYLSNNLLIQRVIAIPQRSYIKTSSIRPGPVGKVSRVLVIDPTMPTPDRDAGSRHIWDMLKFLMEHGYSVSFLPANLSKREPYKSQLIDMGVHVITSPEIWSISRYLKLNQKYFDTIILSRYSVARRYMRQINLAQSPTQNVIFNTEDLQYLRLKRQATTTHNKLLNRYSENVRHQEQLCVEFANYTIVVSEREKQLLHKILPQKNVLVIPLTSTKVSHFPVWDTRFGVLFVGGFRHYPNVDGLRYFLREVWPIVRQDLRTIKLKVIGSPIPRFKQVSMGGVEFLGNVRSVEPFLHSTRISIAPLRFGAGLKGKVLESLSFGVPVVGTSIAAEGFEPLDESGILIADNPIAMARSIIQLHNDREYWHRKSEQSRGHVTQHFSQEINEDLLISIRAQPKV